MIPFQKNAMLRSVEGQKGYGLGAEIGIFCLVFLVSQIISSIPSVFAGIILAFQTISAGNSLNPVDLAANMPDWVMAVSLFSTGLATLVVFLFCKIFQKRNPASLGFTRRHAFREYGIGVLIGALLFSASVGVCMLFDGIELSVTPTWSLGMWFVFLFGFLIQGMSEEVLCRGYFMVSLTRRSSVWIAVLINSTLFALLHIFNNGISLIALLNITLVGILFSLYILRRGDLWGACAIHSIWNFVQGNVFGVAVSGTTSGPSPLSASLPNSASLINGGSFGLEGGLAVTLVLVVGILALLFFVPNKKEDSF